jgi:hypothetical protein
MGYKNAITSDDDKKDKNAKAHALHTTSGSDRTLQLTKGS